MKNPFVSVVILNYNGKEYLANCLNSLKKTRYPKNKFEIIVADNNSSDDSINYISKKFKDIKKINYSKNYGYSEGNNKTVKFCKGKYVAFLNPDVEVEPLWLSPIIYQMEKDEKVIACGGKVLFMDDKSKVNSKGLVITPVGSGYDIDFGKKDITYDSIKRVCAPSGSSIVVRKSDFKKIGGFDNDYFAYVEELDFGYRANIYGYKSLYVPESIFYHKVKGIFNKNPSDLSLMYSERNRMITIIKNFERITALFSIFLSEGYYLYRFIKLLLFLQPKKSIILSKGHFMFWREFMKHLDKRENIQKNRKVSDSFVKKIKIYVSFYDAIKEELRIK